MAESRIVLYGAMAANVAIALTKFTAAGFTGSSSMLSEGIHSLVDTSNGALLLVGERRSQRPASPEHPFGHGKELYFWSLIVAVLIFGLGGGLSFYEGVSHVRHPETLKDPMWNYIVLACAAVFEGASFTLAWRHFSRERGDRPFWRAVHTSKNPSNYTVIAEDGAALIGLALAALGVWSSHFFEIPELDGLASMAIGVLLATVAIFLIRESRGLLLGEGVRPETAKAIRELACAQPRVRHVGPLLSMYVGAEDVLLTFDAHFEPGASAQDIAASIRHIESTIRHRFPVIKRIYIEPVATQGSEAQKG